MPLGSESTLGLAGPNGTPLIAELPAPADPAGGVSCAKACAGRNRLPSAKARTSAELRDIQVSPSGCTFNDDLGRAFPQRKAAPSFPRVVVGRRRGGPQDHALVNGQWVPISSPATGSQPPYRGAQQAPDGNWYVKRGSQNFRVMQQGGAKPGNDPLSQARVAIAQGADPAAVKQRLLQLSIDPSGL
jgi:hypothetical protein